MEFTKKKGLEQIRLIIALENEGVNIEPELFKDLDYENTYLAQIRHNFDWNFKTYIESKIPEAFRFKTTNFYEKIMWNPSSQYSITREKDKFYLIKGKDEVLDEVDFEHKPPFYNLKTSDGTEMCKVVHVTRACRGKVGIIYSNECALLEKGLDCLFCNINDTKRKFAEKDGIVEWKNPRQIGESVAAAFKDGYSGFHITGGFVPERREVEYYLDVIDCIREYAGTDDVRGTACIGAPNDLSIIEKYKEAGYAQIATNIEIWDKNMFKTICPGKEQLCGGQENWIAVLKHEVEVFGRGNVRSQLVGGIEPKKSLLEGIEYLGELGVLAYPTVWRPCIGSGLEGHRSPESGWHQEVAEATYQIHKKLKVPYDWLDEDSLWGYFRMVDKMADKE